VVERPMDERAILRTELRWVIVVAIAVLIIVGSIVISSAAVVLHPPSSVERIDPTTLHVSGEFVEDNLGAVQNRDGSVTVRLVATQFAFVPNCIVVPADRPVTFRITSPDVIHGLLIVGTNVNTMVMPGYVSEVRTTFPRTGEHLMPCHEFCGLGHSEMWSRVRVVEPAAWQPDENGRVSCETPARSPVEEAPEETPQ
jgi:Heme/copper-type cytochrome/quinol oxidases, subunit 2